MFRRVALLVLLTLVLGLALTAAPAQAGGASCWADPVVGPPGTTFWINCSGFSALTYVNAYVVEPDGRAVSAGQVIGVQGYGTGSAFLTDTGGNVSFAWHSQDGSHEQPGGGAFAHQIGDWTWVVHELGLTETVVAQGQATVTIDSKQAPQAGASLSASSTDWQTWWFNGSGFVPGETVNVWVSLPANCSGRANVESASADDPYIQGLFDGFFGPSNVKAGEDGSIAFSVVFSSRACLGNYALTAYAPGSGAGAIVEFLVSGNEVATSSGAWLLVTPNSVSALDPYIVIDGYGFSGGEVVSCWTTRPDGRTFPVGNASASGGGSFSLSTHASGFDSFNPYASEEPGWWQATCRGNASGVSAITTFFLYALESDP